MVDRGTAQPRLVLASSSTYRQELLASLGVEFEVVEPAIDERAADQLLATLGPAGLAVHIAMLKGRSVLEQVLAKRAVDHAGVVVLAGDQLGVVVTTHGPQLLHKADSLDAAVKQLMMLSGGEHLLINGLCVLDSRRDSPLSEVDVHRISMRRFSTQEARIYVERCTPLDCAGSYRIEDDCDFIQSVEGSGDSGVIGLPLALTQSLLEQSGIRVRGLR